MLFHQAQASDIDSSVPGSFSGKRSRNCLQVTGSHVLAGSCGVIGVEWIGMS